MSKPIRLFSHASGPNPWKVAIILEELGLPYESEFCDMAELHTPKYEKYNPNGRQVISLTAVLCVDHEFSADLVLRVPIIIDRNNSDLTLWESGAIVQYLIEKYDTNHKISFTSPPETYYAMQWLHFQTSGQGPYFGQATWFVHFHHEKIPSAKERYLKEILRVTKVLDSALKDKDWLVGGKCSFADLAFVPWYGLVPFIDQESTLHLDEECPHYAKWMKALLDRPAVKKVMADKQAAMSAGK